MFFEDRNQAADELTVLLGKYRDDPDMLVLALPRGGVVLGARLAHNLNLSLDVVMVRKIGHPTYSEYAIGALAEDTPAIYDQGEVVAIDKGWFKQREQEARSLIKKRLKLYYGDKPKRKSVKNQKVILVDDGIATGFTMEAAISAIKNKGAKKIIIATPVASPDSLRKLSKLVDEIVLADKPENFLGAVGSHYYKFEQVSDEEVKSLLNS